MNCDNINVFSPGRICLFGEHQDYLGLPVIAAAINLGINLKCQKRDDRIFHIELPDIKATESIDLDKPIFYNNNKDYLRSGINVLLRKKSKFSNGYDCTISGTIPINSGSASSSAMTVAWITFLNAVSSRPRDLDPEEIARIAYESEVLEFNEYGGMMDQFIASMGNLRFIDPEGTEIAEALPGNTGRFVLGDSHEPKDTQSILSKVKEGALDAIRTIYEKNNNASMKTLTLEELNEHENILNARQIDLLKANIINRDLTIEARKLLSRKDIDDGHFGNLLNKHQDELRDRLGVSTPKIDRMIDASLKTGALGAKINGSGGGGCMFAYTPDSYEQVAEAIKNEGGDPTIVTISEGTRISFS